MATDSTHNDKQQRFLKLLEPNHTRLARFARAMTKSREDAQDLVSDTIEAAYKHFESLRHEEAFLSWLFSIAARLEKRRRWKAMLFSPFDSEHEEVSPAQGASRTASPETLADTELLYEALQKIPAKHREAFVLFEVSGFSLQEIQELQGGSLSAVKMRLVRAREQLRTLLGDTTHEHGRTATIHRLVEAPNTRTMQSSGSSAL